MLGPKRLTRLSLGFALKKLLEFVDPALSKMKSCHLYAGRDTAQLARIVQDWRTVRSRINVTKPQLTSEFTADFHIFVAS